MKPANAFRAEVKTVVLSLRTISLEMKEGVFGYAHGGEQIGFELPGEHFSQFGAISRDADFKIQPETTSVEVGSPDQAVVVIHDDSLGMQHTAVIFPDFHAGTYHFVEIGAGGSRDQTRIAHFWNKQANIDTSQRG